MKQANTTTTNITTNNNYRQYQLPPIQTIVQPDLHYYALSSPLTPPLPTQEHSPVIKSKSNSRRTSHGAIEKRRREKMNDKMESLKKLIPACTPQFPFSVQQPIQKLSVLQAAIDYIQELHNQLQSSLPKDDPLLKDLFTVVQRQTNQEHHSSVSQLKE